MPVETTGNKNITLLNVLENYHRLTCLPSNDICNLSTTISCNMKLINNSFLTYSGGKNVAFVFWSSHVFIYFLCKIQKAINL